MMVVFLLLLICSLPFLGSAISFGYAMSNNSEFHHIYPIVYYALPSLVHAPYPFQQSQMTYFSQLHGDIRELFWLLYYHLENQFQHGFAYAHVSTLHKTVCMHNPSEEAQIYSLEVLS